MRLLLFIALLLGLFMCIEGPDFSFFEVCINFPFVEKTCPYFEIVTILVNGNKCFEIDYEMLQLSNHSVYEYLN